MKLKIDENLGPSIAARLRDAGHDVTTVLEQDLGGATDERLFMVCQGEERALVTLDLDFADPRRFDPSTGAGIAVLRTPNRPGRAHINTVVAQLLDKLAHADLTGSLWIVEAGRVRQYEGPAESGSP